MLSRLLRPQHEERGINLSQYAAMWREANGVGYSPVAVTTASAFTHAASSACVETLAASVAALPLDGVRMQGKRRIEVTPPPPLIREPSALVDPDVWLSQVMVARLTDGNAFGEITTYGAGGLPTSIELYNPEQVIDRRIIDGKASVVIDGERRFLWPYGDVWHCPGPFVTPGSPFGESPIQRARATVGAAIAARDFGSQFFADGGHPGGILTKEGDLTPEQAQALKSRFLAATKGNREPAVFSSDISYTPIMVDPNDSQFIDLMRFAIEEACRFWRVPPAMIYAATSGQNVTYANVSQADLHYLKHSLEGHLVRIERALTKLLPRPQFARFNRDAFLRSDPATRHEIYSKRLNDKTIAVNEVRALEDEPPFGPEYDAPGIPGATPTAGPTQGDVQP